MPRWTTRSVRKPPIDRPSKMRPPSVGLIIPITVFKTVDLPAPFGPIMLTTSPGAMASETSCRIWTLPYPALIPRTSRIGPTISAAKVRLHHPLIRPDLGWRPLGDHVAVIEDEDLLADFHH